MEAQEIDIVYQFFFAGAGCVEAPTINIAAQSSSTLQETGTD
jgi:hypothetical protein